MTRAWGNRIFTPYVAPPTNAETTAESSSKRNDVGDCDDGNGDKDNDDDDMFAFARLLLFFGNP